MNAESAKARLLSLLRDAAAQADVLADGEAHATFDTIARDLLAARFPVVVCGEFKRGKSSTIGSLLGDASLCPADIDIATNLVTAVEYGVPERIEVRLGDRTVPIRREEISEYVTEQGNKRNQRAADYLRIATPNERLRSGLVFYDTPGIGGLNAAHGALTYAILPSAALAIFVADVSEPLLRSELEFFERTMRHVGRVLVVLTRADLVGDPGPVIRDTQRKLAPLMGKAEQDVEVIAISNAAYADYLTTNDPRDFSASNFEALEAALAEILANDRTRLLVERSIGNARAAVQRLRAPLETERAAYADQGGAAVAEIEQQLRDAEERLAALSGESANWRKILLDELEDGRIHISSELEKGWRRIENAFNTEHLNDDRLLAKPELIASALERDVALVLGSTSNALVERIAAIGDRVGAASGLTVEAGRLVPLQTTLQHDGLTSLPVDRKQSALTRGFIFARNASGGALVANLGASVSGALGAGALVAPLAPVLLTAGLAIGVHYAFAQLGNEERTAKREAIRTALRGPLADAHLNANAELLRTLRSAERTMIERFERGLREELRTVKASHAALTQARGASKAEATRRLAEVNRMLQPLEGLDAGLQSLADAADPEIAPPPTEAWADA